MAFVAAAIALFPALAGDKESAQMYYEAGVKALSQGNEDGAVEQFKKALALYPLHAPSNGGIAKILSERGDLASLETLYSDYIKNVKSGGLSGEEAAFEKEARENLALLNEISNLDRQYSKKFAALGKSLEKKDQSAALDAYETAAALDGQNKEASKYVELNRGAEKSGREKPQGKKSGSALPEEGAIFNGKDLDDFAATIEAFTVEYDSICGNQKGSRNLNPAILMWKGKIKGDFRFSVTIQRQNYFNESHFGIVFGTNGRFMFSFYGKSGECRLVDTTDPGKSLATGKLEIPNRPDEWRRLTLTVSGDTATVTCEGQNILSGQMKKYRPERVGIYVYCCMSSFKNLELRSGAEENTRRVATGMKVTEKPEPEKTPPEKSADKEKKPKKPEEPAGDVTARILEKLAKITPEGYACVPAGEFQQGCQGYGNNPAKKVNVDAFFIKKHEITMKEFKPFKNQKGLPDPQINKGFGLNEQWDWHSGEFPAGKDDYPVVMTTWNEKSMYCKWLGEKTGRVGRMPTMAEWEKAASWNFVENVKYKYPWGNEEFQPDWFQKRNDGGGGSPVGSHPKDKSFCGCFDMFGNVMEDCDGDDPSSRGRGPTMGLGPCQHGLAEVTSGGDKNDWRGWHVGFRSVLIPTAKEKAIIEKIMASKGEFDVDEYIEQDRKGRMANFQKELFKCKVVKKDDEYKFSYKFDNPELIRDFVYAGDINKPNSVSDKQGIWDYANKTFAGGGDSIAFAKAAFAGNATFDVQLKLKNGKNLLLVVASIDEPEASMACFAIGSNTGPLLDERAEKCVKAGYVNLAFRLKKGTFETKMISCAGQVTITPEKIECEGDVAITAKEIDGEMINNVHCTGSMNAGGDPVCALAKKVLKSGDTYKFTVKVAGGYAEFFMGKELLGITTAPKGAYRFGVTAYNSMVEIEKMDLQGQVDENWIRKEIEKQ
jgi:formylglycine-generating enzyme required for sulfatase activity